MKRVSRKFTTNNNCLTFINCFFSDTTIELLDQALSAHVKILDYSCTRDRDSQKEAWLEKCINELKKADGWVVPALRQIRDICCLYPEAPTPGSQASQVQMGGHHGQRGVVPATKYRHEIINHLQSQHALVILIANSLTNYMDEVRRAPHKGEPADYYPDGKFNHMSQVKIH